MEHRVAQTELDSEEYSALATTAKKNNLSIKEALRQAALQWVQEKSGINPDDPIFTIQLIDNTKSSEITIHGQTRQSRQSFRNRNS